MSDSSMKDIQSGKGLKPLASSTPSSSNKISGVTMTQKNDQQYHGVTLGHFSKQDNGNKNK